MLFTELGLSAELLQAVTESGYTEPTPVQAQAIPAVLAGRDVMAAAQTGTGKTAAFTLPILHKLQPFANKSVSPAMHPVRALILTPTRELCDQVADSVETYGKTLPLRSLEVFGGMSMEPQVKALMAGVEIVVATPGRLLDHVQQKTINLQRVDILVLDEADRMLDMGFIQDIRRILTLLPARRQTLLFSATFAPEIRKLAQEFMHDPVVIEVARRNTTAENVEQVFHAVRGDEKTDALVNLVQSHQMSQAIIFTRTRQTAETLSRTLARRGINCAAIHGDKDQATRLATLSGFKEGRIHLLVATDVAARGLDIDALPFVINYELPPNPEDYVHRIGRTGRAGASGKAISLFAPEEKRYVEAIEKFIKREPDIRPLPPSPQPERAARTERPERGERRDRDDSRERPARAERGARDSRGERDQASARPRRSDIEVPDLPPALRGSETRTAPLMRRARQLPALLLPPYQAPTPPVVQVAPSANAAPESVPEPARSPELSVAPEPSVAPELDAARVDSAARSSELIAPPQGELPPSAPVAAEAVDSDVAS